MTAEFKPLSEKSSPLQKHAGQALGAPVNRSRRRLVNGVASGAGVLLSVHAKTALGGTGVCQSPSAMMSGNASHPHGPANCTGGRSPGFWKVPQHFGDWTAGGNQPPTFVAGTLSDCASGLKGVELTDVATPGTLASVALNDPGISPIVGVWAVIAFPGSFTNGQLMRHLLCAYLNACRWPTNYPISIQQVRDMWSQLKSGGTYCPSSMTSCGSLAMTATQVINYIEGLYDVNEMDVTLCIKKH